MAGLPDIPVDSALARLFGQKRVQENVTSGSRCRAARPCSAGDQSDQLFFLRAGRLGAFRREEGQEPQFLGVIRPGEPAGEMALIAGAPHSADVVRAARFRDLRGAPRRPSSRPATPTRGDDRAGQADDPAQPPGGHAAAPVGEPSVFGFVPLGRPGAHAAAGGAHRPRDRPARLFGHRAWASRPQTAPTEWFSEVERTHDFVLYVAETRRRRLAQRGRRARWTGCSASGAATASRRTSTPSPRRGSPLQAQSLVDLILVQPADTQRAARLGGLAGRSPSPRGSSTFAADRARRLSNGWPGC